MWNRRKSGEVFPEWLSISNVTDAQGKLTHHIALFITERKKEEAQMEQIGRASCRERV